MIEQIKENTHQKVITKKVFTESIRQFSSPTLLDEKAEEF